MSIDALFSGFDCSIWNGHVDPEACSLLTTKFLGLSPIRWDES